MSGRHLTLKHYNICESQYRRRILRIHWNERYRRFKVDVGRYAGCTLGELAMTHPGDLAWYVKNYAGRNVALKAGATVLLNAVEKMAS